MTQRVFERDRQLDIRLNTGQGLGELGLLRSAHQAAANRLAVHLVHTAVDLLETAEPATDDSRNPRLVYRRI